MAVHEPPPLKNRAEGRRAGAFYDRPVIDFGRSKDTLRLIGGKIRRAQKMNAPLAPLLCQKRHEIRLAQPGEVAAQINDLQSL